MTNTTTRPSLLNFCLAISGVPAHPRAVARENLPALISTEKPKHTTTMKATTMKDKYGLLARATLPALFVTAALVLNTTAIAQAPPGSLWYNGDFNHVNELANERNTIVSQAAVYDDFNITGGPM